jgi:hypothetical protein
MDGEGYGRAIGNAIVGMAIGGVVVGGIAIGGLIYGGQSIYNFANWRFGV